MAAPGLPTSITPGVTTGHAANSVTAHTLLNAFDTTIPSGSFGEVLAMGASGRYEATTVATGTIEYPFILVASTDASTAVKSNAHFTCDGTADQVQINSAIDLASALVARGGAATGTQAGMVLLTGGNFNCSGSILMRNGVTLEGMGWLTRVTADGITASTGAGTDLALIKLFDPDQHGCHVRNMWLYGNYVSGGANVSGVYFDGEGGGDQTAWPVTTPDSYNTIEGLFIDKFTNSGTRHGVRIKDTNQRGTRIQNCDIRTCGTHAVWIDNAPDGIINGVMGSAGGDGVRMDGANWRVVNTKMYYCNSYGFNFLNARMVASGIEVQDSYNGVNVAGTDNIIEGLLIDNCDITGLTIAASRVKVGFSMLHRGGGRYANMNTGVSFSGTQTAINVQGVITNTDITTPVTGTTSGSANFVRISHGTTLVSQG